MIVCKNCGSSIDDNAKFCTTCGQTISAEMPSMSINNEPATTVQQSNYQQPVYNQPSYQNGYNNQQPYQQPYSQQQIYINNTNPQIPAEYKPLSPWAYIGYGILYVIPIVGFILMIVFSFSGGNINKRNFARSFLYIFLIYIVIGIVIFLIMLATGASLFSALGSSSYYYY